MESAGKPLIEDHWDEDVEPDSVQEAFKEKLRQVEPEGESNDAADYLQALDRGQGMRWVDMVTNPSPTAVT